jgi:hypothetical protein
VTLLGYSLGARVIYSCLLSLAERRAFGIVEAVVLIGAPIPSEAAEWRAIRAVVSGRVVNVHSANDYILAFLYRTSSIQKGVAGLQAIDGVPGVENFDVSARVSGHLRYRHMVGNILRRIGWEDVDMEELRHEMQGLKLLEEMEERKKAEAGKGGEGAQIELLEKDTKSLSIQNTEGNLIDLGTEPADTDHAARERERETQLRTEQETRKWKEQEAQQQMDRDAKMDALQQLHRASARDARVVDVEAEMGWAAQVSEAKSEAGTAVGAGKAGVVVKEMLREHEPEEEEESSDEEGGVIRMIDCEPEPEPDDGGPDRSGQQGWGW